MKRLLGIFSIFLLTFFLQVQSAKADVWGAAYGAAIAKRAMDTAYEEMQAAILGTLKVTAYELLHTQVGQLIGGTSVKESFIISDWEDFIVRQPMDRSVVYMNDFFSASFQAKNSCDYIPLTSSSVGGDPFQDVITTSCASLEEGVRFVQNFPSYLEEYARATIGGEISKGVDKIQEYTLDQFCSDPSEMFASGNWKCWDAYFSNDFNNPYGYSLLAEKKYYTEIEKNREIARLQSMAYQGYKPQTTGDGLYVITPGSLIKDIQSSVTDLGNKIIAAAKSPEEFFSSLVTSFVTSFIQQTVRNGVGELQQHIQTEIREADKKMSTEVNRVVEEVGLRARYMPLYQSDNKEWKDYYKGN